MSDLELAYYKTPEECRGCRYWNYSVEDDACCGYHSVKAICEYYTPKMYQHDYYMTCDNMLETCPFKKNKGV